jgi:hypothetical protein
MDYLSCCPLLLVVSGADRVLAGQRLSCPGTAVGSASHTGSTGSRWEVIMNVVVGRSAAGQETVGEAVPEFYVALEFTGDGRCCRPGLPSAPLTEVVVRVTATGTALAAISAPRPYSTFTGVTAAADHRTFVLAAQKPARLPLTTHPVTRFFLLRIDPASPVPAGRARLEPLAIPEQPPGRVVSGLAVSPDASRLAVTVGPFPGATGLHVFTLATGVRRVWDGPAVGPAVGPGAGWSCPHRPARKTRPAITGARS